MKERLQKIISAAGITSRRAAEQLIIDGKVKVNGRPASLGDSADSFVDIITVEGRRIQTHNEKKYIMLYKPRGYVTTMQDERGRKNVSMLVDVGTRVYPIGRLDLNSEGLLLMTNDGDLANKLTHPSHNIKKIYHVKVKGDFERVGELGEPMEIDGHVIEPAKVFILWKKDEEGEGTLEIAISEGRNRQIRKMCEEKGFDVLWLKRVAIGKIKLDPALKPGRYRALKHDELDYLRAVIKTQKKEE